MLIDNRLKTKLSEIFTFFILFLSLLPVGLSKMTVPIQILLSLAIISISHFRIIRLSSVLVFIVLIIISFLIKVNLDQKDMLLILSAFFSCVFTNVRRNTLEKYLKLMIVLIFSVCFLQMIAPNFPLWTSLAENKSQADLFKLGYASYSLLGNPTHTAYFSLFLFSALFTLNNKLPYTWLFITFVTLLLAKNKICLLVFITLFSFSYGSKLKGYAKLNLFILLAVLLTSLWFFVFKEYSHWLTMDVSRIHTISYRLEIFNLVVERMDNLYNILIGSSSGLNDFDKPFDSGVSLLLYKYGVIITLVIYCYLYFLCGRNVLVFLALALPSVTMVAFFNAQFMIPIIMICMSVRSNLEKN